MSKEERNKGSFQALYNEVMNTGNLPLTDTFMTPDRPDHDPGFPPEMTTGREGFKRAIGWIRSVFPDLTFTTEFMVAEGDYVVCYNHVAGTQTGDLMGMPVTGRKVALANIDICRFTEKGLIAEHWGTFNMAELFKQLGVGAQPEG